MRRIAVSSFCLAFAFVCAAEAVKVQTQVAPGADLSKYSTYRWETPSGPGGPGMDEKIRAAADKTLAARGLKLADEAEKAGALVLTYNVGAADQLAAGFSVDADYWGNLVLVPGSDSNVSAGIILFLSDPSSNAALWAGWMILRGTSPQALMVMRDRAPGYAEKILSKYPKKR